MIRVDRPLVSPIVGIPTIGMLDGSAEAKGVEPGGGLTLRDPAGHRIEVELPDDWPGPTGRIDLARPLDPGPPWTSVVRATSWGDELGGMGAGFAAAFGGELISALGPEDDPTSMVVSAMLAREGIMHRPIRVPGTTADWTLLVSSGEHGDKLAIGFRGCHAAMADLGRWADVGCRLRLVAALPNRLAELALAGPSKVRAFAPSSRNMLDRDRPLGQFVDLIDILCCNRGEWESLADDESMADRLAILSVTDGADGASIRSRDEAGDRSRIHVPAFPRDRPPRDTNRAGEAFASTLIRSLLDGGWTPGPTSPDLLRRSAWRASAAAALVLDRLDFGFPTEAEVDRAVRAGRVA